MNWNNKMLAMTLPQFFAVLYLQSAEVSNNGQAAAKLLAVTNSLVERELSVSGPPGQTNIHLSAERIVVATGVTRVEHNLLVLYHRQTGFVWWSFGGQSQQDVERLAAENRLWVIPDVGIVEIQLGSGGFSSSLFRTKANSMEEARASITAKLETIVAEGPRFSRRDDLVHVPLLIPVGMSFFFLPDDASPPPRPKILSCNYTNKVITFELESAITRERAVFEMDSDFRVRRAYRAGSLRFDRDDPDPSKNGSWRTNTGIPGVIDMRDEPPPNR